MLLQKCLIIVGCSKTKLAIESHEKIRAIDLYQGGIFPDLKSKFRLDENFLDHLYILSGRHGLFNSKTLLHTYDHQLSYEETISMAPIVSNEAIATISQKGTKKILVIAEPNYFALLSGLLQVDSEFKIYWEPNIRGLSEWAYNQILQFTLEHE